MLLSTDSGDICCCLNTLLSIQVFSIGFANVTEALPFGCMKQLWWGCICSSCGRTPPPPPPLGWAWWMPHASESLHQQQMGARQSLRQSAAVPADAPCMPRQICPQLPALWTVVADGSFLDNSCSAEQPESVTRSEALCPAASPVLLLHWLCVTKNRKEQGLCSPKPAGCYWLLTLRTAAAADVLSVLWQSSSQLGLPFSLLPLAMLCSGPDGALSCVLGSEVCSLLLERVLAAGNP